jgi:hypothetical protein
MVYLVYCLTDFYQAVFFLLKKNKMKKIIYVLSITASIMTGVILTRCQTPAQKVETAKEDLKTANQELNDEFPSFKKDAEVRLAANETTIKELRSKLTKSGNGTTDADNKKKIDELETKNGELRSKLYGYEGARTDWNTFKTKFNHDADNLTDALKDFGKDLEK